MTEKDALLRAEAVIDTAAAMQALCTRIKNIVDILKPQGWDKITAVFLRRYPTSRALVQIEYCTIEGARERVLILTVPETWVFDPWEEVRPLIECVRD